MMKVRKGRQPFMHTLAIGIGDILIFILFTAVGRMEHRMEVTVGGLLETALPFVVTWLVAGYFMGAYSARALSGLPAMGKHVTLAWLVACPVGVLLRAAILQIPVSLQFAGVTLGFVWLLLLGWRLPYAFIANKARGARWA